MLRAKRKIIPPLHADTSINRERYQECCEEATGQIFASEFNYR